MEDFLAQANMSELESDRLASERKPVCGASFRKENGLALITKL